MQTSFTLRKKKRKNSHLTYIYLNVDYFIVNIIEMLDTRTLIFKNCTPEFTGLFLVVVSVCHICFIVIFTLILGQINYSSYGHFKTSFPMLCLCLFLFFRYL